MKKTTTYFCLFVIFVGGFFLRSLVLSYSEHSKEIAGLKSEISNLQSRIDTLHEQKAFLASRKDLWDKLDLAVPDTYDVQNYILIDLLKLWSARGFGIDGVTPKEGNSAGSGMEVLVETIGNAREANRLIDALMEHPRKSVVTNVRISSSKVPNHITLTMKIFALDLLQLNDARIDIEFLERELEPAHEL